LWTEEEKNRKTLREERILTATEEKSTWDGRRGGRKKWPQKGRGQLSKETKGKDNPPSRRPKESSEEKEGCAKEVSFLVSQTKSSSGPLKKRAGRKEVETGRCWT